MKCLSSFAFNFNLRRYTKVTFIMLQSVMQGSTYVDAGVTASDAEARGALRTCTPPTMNRTTDTACV
jgi:hypothetical protein